VSKIETWVLDCSIVSALCLGEEQGAVDADRLFARLVRAEVRMVVPAHFWVEIGNVLAGAVRAGRISANDAERSVYFLDERTIETAASIRGAGLLRVMRFTRELELTVYDAAYVELADRLGARLKTLDTAILRWRDRFAWIE
jgi:predicted nucleic acid-binding protein